MCKKRCRAGICTALVAYSIDREVHGLPRLHTCVSGSSDHRGEKEVHVLDQELCIKCGSCYEKCRFDAVRRS